MNIGIILAAGKSTRFKKQDFNKTTAEFLGKPLVRYGSDLFSRVCERVVVVVGKNSREVMKAVGNNPKVVFVYQNKRLGTGHAVKVALKEVKKRGWVSDNVFVGMGDHMMFYSTEIVERLLRELNNKNATVALITCEYKDPDSLFWGRIIRTKTEDVAAIVEQKDASQKQRKIKELNPAFYCFRFDFLEKSLAKIKRSPVSREYYLTDLIKIANDDSEKVVALKVPFKYVGLGINTQEELEISQRLFKKYKAS